MDDRIRNCNAVGFYGWTWLPLITAPPYTEFYDPAGLKVVKPKSAMIFTDWRGVAEFMQKSGVEYLRHG